METQAAIFPCQGCGTRLTLQQFPIHLVSCDQVNIACPACQQVMKKADLIAHSNVCERRMIHCEKCTSRFYHNDRAEHDAKCSEWTLKRKFIDEIKLEIRDYLQTAVTNFTEQLNSNKRVKPNNNNNTAERTAQTFEADEILDMRMRNGIQYYNVKWKPVNGMRWENTWEPRANLFQCPHLLAAFDARAAEAIARLAEDTEPESEEPRLLQLLPAAETVGIKTTISADEKMVEVLETRNEAPVVVINPEEVFAKQNKTKKVFGSGNRLIKALREWILSKPPGALLDKKNSEVYTMFSNETGVYIESTRDGSILASACKGGTDIGDPTEYRVRNGFVRMRDSTIVEDLSKTKLKADIEKAMSVWFLNQSDLEGQHWSDVAARFRQEKKVSIAIDVGMFSRAIKPDPARKNYPCAHTGWRTSLGIIYRDESQA